MGFQKSNGFCTILNASTRFCPPTSRCCAIQAAATGPVESIRGETTVQRCPQLSRDVGIVILRPRAAVTIWPHRTVSQLPSASGRQFFSCDPDESWFMLSHTVYFTLKDSSDSACQKLVDACHSFLKGHSGIAFFAAGRLASEFNRPVNDLAYHVALQVVFDDRESHDVYQVSENHLAFIAEGKENWEQVRVFDAWVD